MDMENERKIGAAVFEFHSPSKAYYQEHSKQSYGHQKLKWRCARVIDEVDNKVEVLKMAVKHWMTIPKFWPNPIPRLFLYQDFFPIPNFPKPRLFFLYQIFRNRNRYPQKISKSFETKKFRNRNVNICLVPWNLYSLNLFWSWNLCNIF